jgi:acyl-CoA synthetase (AMP-forming)/AMP-acid ligase II
MMTGRPDSIAEALILNAEHAPEKLRLRFEEEEWTYKEFRERVENFAAASRTWGLRLRDRVAPFLESCPNLLAAYLGTHLAGGVVVPVNTQYRKRELRHILCDAGVRLCLADEETRREVECGDLPDPEFGERVVAVVVRDDPGLTPEKVAEFCRKDLAGYKKPRQVVFVEALPRNALGKVLKHEVREELIESEE